MKETKKKRRRKKRGNSILLFCIMTVITVVVILGLLIFLKIKYSKPFYEYVSMSEEAAARAYIWLNQMEDMPLSYEEIKEMMGDIRLELILTPTGEKGRYMRALADGTFEDCQEKAQAGLEKAYREVAGYRFFAAGYEGDILDDMMQEVYGVSVSEYLSYCKVQLIPTLVELTEMYSGEVTNE